VTIKLMARRMMGV